MNYIQETQTEEGVDFVILKDGRVLGIDADYVCLYASMDDFYAATSQTKPTIYLKEQTA
jgi:hypothetical protein